MRNIRFVANGLNDVYLTFLSTALHKTIQGGMMDDSRQKAVVLLVCLAGHCSSCELSTSVN